MTLREKLGLAGYRLHALAAHMPSDWQRRIAERWADEAMTALAAGTQRAETTEELAQSEGCQSGDAKQRNAQTFQQTTRESPLPNKRGDSNHG